MLPNDNPYLIGETAFHHEGDIEFLKDLIHEAVNAEINAVKFHLLFDIHDYMIKDHEAKEKLSEICIAEEEWNEILEYLYNLPIDPIFLCNDRKSFDWVLKNQDRIKAVEIHGSGLNDVFLLEKATHFDGTVVLGIGGSTLDEIKFAVEFLKCRDQDDILLMHGFQSYPTDYEKIKLSRIPKIKNLFNLPVGYADHTDPKDPNNKLISILPAAMGYNVLEKHFTHKPGEDRIDSQAAVNLQQLTEIKKKLEVVWSAKGELPFDLSEDEQKYGETGPMKKAIVAREKIRKGDQLTIEKIAYKRTNRSTYIKQRDIVHIQNAIAICNISEDEIIDYTKIEFGFNKGNFEAFKIDKK